MRASGGQLGQWWGRVNAAAWVVVAILVLTLTREVRALREVRREFARARAYPVPGQWVPRVRAATLSGDSVTVGETTPGRSQLIFVLTTSCPYCRASLPAWKRITDSVLADSAGRHDVYWISLSPVDSTAQYVADHGLTAPVVFPPDSRMMRVYRVKGVPITLILTARGQLVYVRPGELTTEVGVDSVLAMMRLVDERAALDTATGGGARKELPSLPSRR